MDPVIDWSTGGPYSALPWAYNGNYENGTVSATPEWSDDHTLNIQYDRLPPPDPITIRYDGNAAHWASLSGRPVPAFEIIAASPPMLLFHPGDLS